MPSEGLMGIYSVWIAAGLLSMLIDILTIDLSINKFIIKIVI